MRRVRYSVAMSLDGYLAGPKGDAYRQWPSTQYQPWCGWCTQ